MYSEQLLQEFDDRIKIRYRSVIRDKLVIDILERLGNDETLRGEELVYDCNRSYLMMRSGTFQRLYNEWIPVNDETWDRISTMLIYEYYELISFREEASIEHPYTANGFLMSESLSINLEELGSVFRCEHCVIENNKNVNRLFTARGLYQHTIACHSAQQCIIKETQF